MDEGLKKMNKSAEQLIIALEKEHDIYQEVLDLAKEKRRIIIEGQVKKLDGITKKEQNMIITLGKLEGIREAVLKNLMTELEIDSIENIEELVEHLDKNTSKKVMDIRNKLLDILEDVKKENDLNGKLIKQSLEFIDFNKNLIDSMENKGSTYGSDADEKNVKVKNNLFDARI